MNRAVAPLVDTFLLVLGLMLVEAEFDTQRDVTELNLPETTQKAKPGSRGSVVQVKVIGERQVSIDGTLHDWSSSEFITLVAGKHVVIQIDKSKPVALLVAAWDACLKARCFGVSMLASEKTESPK